MVEIIEIKIETVEDLANKLHSLILDGYGDAKIFYDVEAGYDCNKIRQFKIITNSYLDNYKNIVIIE